MPWDVFVGDVKLGRLIEQRSEQEIVQCTFEPTPTFVRYAPAFASAEIWEGEDDSLDAVIDEIAVDGVFLVDEDGREIVDPDLRIDGTHAGFSVQSNPSK